jgi:hypothetical protein
LPAAWSVHERRVDAVEPAAGRLFGVYTDPWHLVQWERQVGVKPNLVAKFEAFARRRTADKFIGQVERDGVKTVLVSWEPWRPVPARLGWRAQAQQQPGYANRDIAAGVEDAYITRFARSLSRFDGTVYLRYAHEMNGFWYPWSADSRAYVRAWRHVVHTVRAVAPNVRFVWSVNPNLYEPRHTWLANLRRYWPGASFVDVVGMTMINFGGVKDYEIARFRPALAKLRGAFGKPVFLTETSTARSGRVEWLRELAKLVATRPWIRAIAWSQLPSRGAVQQRKDAGDLNWQVTHDASAAAALRGVARDAR